MADRSLSVFTRASSTAWCEDAQSCMNSEERCQEPHLCPSPAPATARHPMVCIPPTHAAGAALTLYISAQALGTKLPGVTRARACAIHVTFPTQVRPHPSPVFPARPLVALLQPGLF